MTQTIPASTEAVPQISDAEFLASLEEEGAASAWVPTDPAPPPTAPEAAPTVSAATPVDATATGDAGTPAAEEDPITRARREEREAADREWQERYNGVHGNAKTAREESAAARAEAAALKAQLAEADAQRDAEFKQLIDAAESPEQRKYWEGQQQLDQDRRSVARDKALITLRERQTQAAQQQQVAVAGEGLRGAAIPALVDTITGYAAEKGLPITEVQDLLDDVSGASTRWLISEMPPAMTPVYAARRALEFQAAIDRRAAGFAAKQQSDDEAQAKANRERDARTGRFAAGQAGATGGGGNRYAAMSDREFLALVEQDE